MSLSFGVRKLRSLIFLRAQRSIFYLDYRSFYSLYFFWACPSPFGRQCTAFKSMHCRSANHIPNFSPGQSTGSIFSRAMAEAVCRRYELPSVAVSPPQPLCHPQRKGCRRPPSRIASGYSTRVLQGSAHREAGSCKASHPNFSENLLLSFKSTLLLTHQSISQYNSFFTITPPQFFRSGSARRRGFAPGILPEGSR